MNRYDELSSLVIMILSLPHSNGEIERVFSQMNIIKSKLRNRMKTESANALLHIRYGLRRTGNTCVTYELPNTILDLVGSNEKYKSAKDNAGDYSAGSHIEEEYYELLHLIFHDM